MDLPNGWVPATLADFGKWSSGGTPSRKRAEYFGGDIPWVLTGDLDDGIIHQVPNSVTSEGVKNSSAKVFPRNTLLVAMYGATIGKLGILGVEAATNQACAALIPTDENAGSLPFVYYYLLAQRKNLRKAGKGGAQPNISQTVLKDSSIPVPPLNEQHRIVEKIETLFARIDKGEEALQEVQKLLKRYRQSILKAAVTGELTRDWREANQQKLEPASDLLARILEARQENWQGRGKIKEPVLPEIADPPNLPDGWVWTSLDSLLKEFVTGPFGSALHKSDYVDNGIPLVNPINIVDGGIIPDEKKCVDEDTLKRLQRFALELGDVVIARRGDMGRCAAVTTSEEGWLCGTGSMVLRPTPAVLPEFLSLAIRSSYVVSFLETNSVGTTMKNLNQKTLLAAPIAIPSLQEQEAAIDALEPAFEKAGNLGDACKAEMVRSASLRQSILKSAFTGQLVPQNPNDEPASELLARIRAKREATPKAKSRRKAGA